MITFLHYNHIIYIFLAGAAVIVFHLFYSIWRRMALSSAVGKMSAAEKIINGFYSRIMLKEIFIFIAVIVSCICLLGPGWGEKLRETSSEGTDVLIALDVSRSMLARDASPSRLERAKDAVKLIAQSCTGSRLGLIIFAGDAFLQCPLTSDTGAFMMFLDAAGPDSLRVQGTDMGRMLALAGKIYEKKRLTSRMLVVVTDGEDHESKVDAETEKFRELGVSVYTAGIGRGGDLIPLENRTGSENFYRDSTGTLIKTKKNEDLLQKLSSNTGGFYMDITDSFSGLSSLLAVIENKEKTGSGSKLVREKIDRTYIFILILVILLAAEMLIPERRKFLPVISSRRRGDL